MRRRLTVLVAATTSLVVLAFLVPLALLLRTLAEDRAVAAVTTQAQNVAAIAAVEGTNPDRNAMVAVVEDRLPAETSVVFPDGTVAGRKVDDPGIQTASTYARAFSRHVNGDVVVYVPAVGATNKVSVVRTVIPAAQLHRGVGRATAVVVALGVLLLLVSVVAADVLARRVSAPIRNLADAAEALREGRLEMPTPERGPPEVVALAQSLNGLGARIDELLTAERESVADLSHRLRTPVTALRLDAEAVDDPEMAERLQQHVANLERTVDAVVRDARRPVRSTVTASCDATRVVYDRVLFWSALAEEQGRSVYARLPDRPVRARIDQGELQDVVDVLLDNVFAHTAEGVSIGVSVQLTPDRRVLVTVEDGGPGLPTDEVVTRGHSEAGSTGLGLDIVRRAANASGGSLELGSSQLGGARVQVEFGAAESRRSAKQRGGREHRVGSGRLRRLFGRRPGPAAAEPLNQAR